MVSFGVKYAEEDDGVSLDVGCLLLCDCSSCPKAAHAKYFDTWKVMTMFKPPG